MAKSKIIKELANNEIPIDVALKRLLIICSDLNYKDVIDWVECELNGYTLDIPIPEYRNLGFGHMLYTGIKGNMLNHIQLTNQPFPEFWIPKDYRDQIYNVYERDTIANVIKKANASETLSIDRTYLIPLINVGIGFISLSQNYDNTRFSEIVNKVGNTVLKIFLELDKKFGCLDNLDIDTSNQNPNEIKQLEKQLLLYIGEMKVINIGDNNEITKSNIGDNNED